jgi:thiamine pyrophosphate-dependent acetolactate synthase large subunit-like protein
MPEIKIYRALANAFVAEGVSRLFVLTGDGNMHWEAALAEVPGFRSIHVRHEHCCCAMASAYAVTVGDVGVASVTCGPGLTQIMTALATAASARIPLVVFSGESPMHSTWYNQHIDQGPLVTATGAHYIQAHSPHTVLDRVREAFLYARLERRPVVIGVPLDLQQQTMAETDYVSSLDLMPDVGPMPPNPTDVARVADKIAAAERIVIIGGRGAVASGAKGACEQLADRCGALLAATLPVRGLFDGHPLDLGVAGGFAHAVTRDIFARADLIIAVGASLTHHTVDGGTFFPTASVIQIDQHPIGIRQGRKVANHYVRGDARLTVEALIEHLRDRQLTQSPKWRQHDLQQRLAGPADPTLFSVEPGVFDPRDVVVALNRAIPRDWDLVNASGHNSYFSAQMRGRSSENFLTIREFGAIGNGLSYAIGRAVARPDRTVVLVDGDGGILMHIQELETVRRHGLKLLVCVLNDGAFGSEIHKLRADGLSDHGAIFGYDDFGRIARGFDLRGQIVDNLEALPGLIEKFSKGDRAEVLDFHISDQVTSPMMRKNTRRASVDIQW